MTGPAGGPVGADGPRAESALEADRRGARPALLVSACLLGRRCTYQGEGNTTDAVIELAQRADLIPVCPEVLGGLPTPRPAAELGADGRVRTAEGEDLTEAYRRGAAAAVEAAQEASAVGAVLKARSPSCGCHGVYDGRHRRVLVPGDGVTAAALRDLGVPLWSEEDIDGGADPLAGA